MSLTTWTKSFLLWLAGFVRMFTHFLFSKKNLPNHSPEMVEDSPATQMISGEGVLKEKDLEDFMKIHECGVSYAIVAIMGPQSSGKSTLLNHLFETKFPEMDASIGRGQVTKGIWIAKAPNMDPFTMVMDVEGTDGKERGEDDTTYEKQSALFAQVVADIFLINIWYHDIGRETAANRPLFKTIFQAMMQIYDKSSPRKTTLHFVIRDMTTQSPFETIETQLRDDVQQIWATVPKTEDFKNTPFSEFFNVEVDALSHYEHKMEQFKEEVVQLRERILESIRVSAHRGDVIPTSVFPLHVKKLWETIKENKNLDLPSLKKMVATVRCEEIAMEKHRLFASDEEWLEVKETSKKGLVSGFSDKISSILSRFLSEYDCESEYLEEGIRDAKRKDLESKAFELVYPAYINTLDHLRTKTLIKFDAGLEELLSKGEGYAESVSTCTKSCELEFDQLCSDVTIKEAKWDASYVREVLVRDMTNRALVVRTCKLPQVVDQSRERLAAEVGKYLKNLFTDLEKEEGFSWPSIRSFLKRETDSAVSAMRSDLAQFDLDQTTLQEHLHALNQYATKLVVNKFKEEADSIKQRLKERFIISLARGEGEAEGLSKCLKLLSTMAAIRLDESSGDDEWESLLLSAVLQDANDISDDHPLASNTWEKVAPEMTLIPPIECKNIWLQFKQDVMSRVEQIKSKEERESESLPYWVRVGTWLLGVVEFASFLRKLEYEMAIQLLILLGVEGINLASTQESKNIYENMKKKISEMTEKLMETLQAFYDSMKRAFTGQMVGVVS